MDDHPSDPTSNICGAFSAVNAVQDSLRLGNLVGVRPNLRDFAGHIVDFIKIILVGFHHIRNRSESFGNFIVQDREIRDFYDQDYCGNNHGGLHGLLHPGDCVSYILFSRAV